MSIYIPQLRTGDIRETRSVDEIKQNIITYPTNVWCEIDTIPVPNELDYDSKDGDVDGSGLVKLRKYIRFAPSTKTAGKDNLIFDSGDTTIKYIDGEFDANGSYKPILYATVLPVSNFLVAPEFVDVKTEVVDYNHWIIDSRKGKISFDANTELKYKDSYLFLIAFEYIGSTFNCTIGGPVIPNPVKNAAGSGVDAYIEGSFEDPGAKASFRNITAGSNVDVKEDLLDATIKVVLTDQEDTITGTSLIGVNADTSIGIKTFVAGTGATLTATAGEVKIDITTTLTNETKVANDAELFKSGTDTIRNITGSKNITITENASHALVSVSLADQEDSKAGESLIGTNADTSIGIKTIVAGTGTSFTATAGEVKIDTTTTLTNETKVSNDAEIYKSGTDTVRNITGSNNVTVTENASHALLELKLNDHSAISGISSQVVESSAKVLKGHKSLSNHITIANAANSADIEYKLNDPLTNAAGMGLTVYKTGTLTNTTPGQIKRIIGGSGITTIDAMDNITITTNTPNVLTVGAMNADYTTIKEACDYAFTQVPTASSKWTIYVMPGTYSELPFVIRRNIVLVTKCAAVITAANDTDTLIKMDINTHICGFTIGGNIIKDIISGNVDGEGDIHITKCVFTQGKYVGSSHVNNRIIICDCKFLAVDDLYGIKSANGYFKINNVIIEELGSTKMREGITILNSVGDIHGVNIEDAQVHGFQAAGTSEVYMFDSFIRNCIFGLRINSSDSDVNIVDCIIENNTTNIFKVLNTLLSVSSITLPISGIPNNDIYGIVNTGEYTRMAGAVQFGDSANTEDLLAYTDNNGTYTDITDNIITSTGSAIFASNATTNSFLIGTSSKFTAISFNVTTALATADQLSLTFERNNGGSWTSISTVFGVKINTMEINKETGENTEFFQIGKKLIFLMPADETWNNGTINSVVKKWYRIKINTLLTGSIPIINNLRVFGLAAALINGNGKRISFGNEMIEKESRITFKEISAGSATTATVEFTGSASFHVLYENSQIGPGDAMGTLVFIPGNLNYSVPPRLHVVVCISSTGIDAFDIQLETGTLGEDEKIQDGVTAKYPLESDLLKETVSVSANAINGQIISEFSFPISSYLFGKNFIVAEIEILNADAATSIAILDSHLNYRSSHTTQ